MCGGYRDGLDHHNPAGFSDENHPGISGALLDRGKPSLTVAILGKAAVALGYKVELCSVPA